MSCYHPLVRHPKWIFNKNLRIWQVDCRKTGETIYTVTPLERYEYELNHNNWPEMDTVQVPCGHCIGCKLDHSRQWADRMLCELQSAQGAGIFVTLTYAPECVPISWYKDNTNCLHRSYTLKKKDLQDFNKLLRRYFDGNCYYPDFKDKNGNKILIPKRCIRFYGAGEYGEMTLRPHYHVIYFGVSLDDVMAQPAQNEAGQIVKNELGHIYYVSNLLEKLWNKGLVSVSEVSWRTCAYVARYVTKKWSSGYSKDDSYKFFGVDREFSLMSRRPGIGSKFFEDWEESHDFEMIDLSKLSLGDQDGAKQIKVPKYFLRKYKDSTREDIRDMYREYAEKAKVLAESRTALQLEQTDLEYLEMLAVAERTKSAAARTLNRDKV